MLLDKPGPTDMSTKNTAVNDIAHVVVVIPAHDEAARLGRLLASMSLARRRVSEKVSTSCVVVADACTDRTAEVARCFLTGGQDVLEEVEVRSVGRARQRGVASAIEGHEDLRRVWIANTDADTVVPDNWLTAQLRLANSGYDAVAGTVTLLEDDDWCPTVAARFEHAYRWPPGTPHPHIHGCNLGVRASTYLEVGGWSERCSAEDGDLWRRLKTHARVLSSAESRVATSARMHGRAPDGFAGHLVSLDQSAFPSRQPAHPCGCQDVDHAGCHELTPARSAS